MIYYSKETDPFINLAIENALLLNIKKDENILFLYQNTPSIILGRFQNPWVECDLIEMAKRKIPLVRRQSGGGTVFHDLGNLNYSFIQGSRDHHNTRNLEILVQALNNLDIKAFYTDRSDMRVMHNEISKKISGAAFKQKKDKSIHHGTMLISSNLNTLNGLLKTPFKVNSAKGIKSIPSTVLNLNEINSNISHDLFIKSCISEFNRFHHTSHLLLEIDKEFLDHDHYKQLISWEWRFGETPKFEYEVKDESVEFLFKLNKGKVIKCDATSSIAPALASHLAYFLNGKELKEQIINEMQSEFSSLGTEAIDFIKTLQSSGLFCTA